MHHEVCRVFGLRSSPITITITITIWRSTQLIRAMASFSVTARFLQIRLNGYKREEYGAYQPVHEVVHTPLQHEQSSPQLQLLGATGWRPVPLSVAYGFLSIVLK